MHQIYHNHVYFIEFFLTQSKNVVRCRADRREVQNFYHLAQRFQNFSSEGVERVDILK